MRHSTAPGRPRIGFACLWEEVPERTWSGTAWNLRAGLRKVSDTVDIGVEFPALPRQALKAIHARYRGGRLTTPWCYSRVTDAFIDRALRRGLAQKSRDRDVAAVLQVEFLASILPVPFYSYADCSWDALFASVTRPRMYADLMSLTPSAMARRRDAQLAMYERAAGIIAMSHWFARSLVTQSGIPAKKVHVVHPGLSAGRTIAGPRSVRVRAAPRRKLLFVGRQNTPYAFYRKGGDLVVAALSILRKEFDPGVTLTLAGLDRWPLPGEIPDGVTVLGALDPDEVARLYDEHDLFVMPSRQESFGLVFAEALAAGLPCVARNAYAMPEIVTPGVLGTLVDGDDPRALAEAIAAVLGNDDIYRQCASRAPDIAAYFSWERTAGDIAGIIGQGVCPEGDRRSGVSQRDITNGTLREGCHLGLDSGRTVRQSRLQAASLEVPMSLTHSPDTHKSLIARIPRQTGSELAEWFTRLESGPAFLRRDERVNWLADEHGICDRYAVAIVQEYEIRRQLRRFGL
jgi:glycosyltransferase involved in cell wall biosynthesis